MKKTKPKATPSKPVPAPIDDAAVHDTTISELQAQLAVIAAKRADLPEGTVDHELVASTALIAKALNMALGERRQRNRAKRIALGAVGDDELIEYIKTLPERRRRSIIDGSSNSFADTAGKPLFP